MKKILAVVIGALLVPYAAGAATLTTDVSLSLTDGSLTISGDSATIDSITVDSNSFDVTLSNGSSIKVSSSDRKPFSISGAGAQQVIKETACLSSESTIKLSSTASDAFTVTVTLGSGTCGGGGGGGPVSGGGGGGGGGAAYTPPSPSPVPASAPSSGLSVAQIDAILSLLASFGADQATVDNVKLALSGKATTGTVTAAFARNLEVGMTGADVKALQQWLNANGYRVAESGPGSPGNETTMFGGATKAALINFQKAKGITPAVGYFGPKTRAAIGQ